MVLFLRAGILPIFVAIIMMGFLRDGIESWLPTLYMQAFKRTAGESILVSAVLPVFSIVAVTAIKIAHKTKLFSNESRGSAVLFLAAAILCVPLAVLINFEQSTLRLVCLVLAALICGTMHAVNFLYISCLPGRFAAYGKAATASGFCNAFTYVGAAISMYGISALAENLGWSATAISWIAISALGALCSLAALRKYAAFLKNNG
jgi:OPA family glycerol-3-phosphate transporter-like MFS transporter